MSRPGTPPPPGGRAAPRGSPARHALAAGLLVLGIGDLAVVDLVLAPRYLAHRLQRAPVVDERIASVTQARLVPTREQPGGGETRGAQAVDSGVAEAHPLAVSPPSTARPATPTPASPALAAPEAAVPPEDFPDLLFAINTTWLSRPSREILDRVAQALQNNPDRRVVLGGHTDGAGDPDFNRALARERARRAGRYLHTHGVDLARIEIRSFGSERPAEDAPSSSPHARNRRVEISVE